MARTFSMSNVRHARMYEYQLSSSPTDIVRAVIVRCTLHHKALNSSASTITARLHNWQHTVPPKRWTQNLE